MNKATTQPEISLITPMYNESDGIQENIKSILKALEELQVSWEYILVDDGSKDDSYKIAQEAVGNHPNCQVIHYSVNRGRGFALRKGFEAAKGKFIITTESDLSWGAGIIKSLYDALLTTKNDIIIASVHLPGGGLENVPPFRRLLTSWGNKVMRWSFGKELTMISGMTRGYRREVIQALYLESDRKEIHLEIVAKAQVLGFTISEIPATIRWNDPKPGQKPRGDMGIVKFIIPHLLITFDRAAFKTIMWVSFIFFAIGLGLSVFGTINKFFFITAIPKPNLVVYGLVLILMAIVGTLFAGLALLLEKIYKSLVHIQSQIKNIKL